MAKFRNEIVVFRPRPPRCLCIERVYLRLISVMSASSETAWAVEVGLELSRYIVGKLQVLILYVKFSMHD